MNTPTTKPPATPSSLPPIEDENEQNEVNLLFCKHRWRKEEQPSGNAPPCLSQKEVVNKQREGLPPLAPKIKKTQ